MFSLRMEIKNGDNAGFLFILYLHGNLFLVLTLMTRGKQKILELIDLWAMPVFSDMFTNQNGGHLLPVTPTDKKFHHRSISVIFTLLKASHTLVFLALKEKVLTNIKR